MISPSLSFKPILPRSEKILIYLPFLHYHPKCTEVCQDFLWRIAPRTTGCHLERRACIEDIGIVEVGDTLIVEAKMSDTSKKVVIGLVPPAARDSRRYYV